MFFGYEIAIKLEIHVDLLTESKMFCSCPNRSEETPNTNICPVCLGLPGSLPVLNKNALELALKAALHLNCVISNYSRFDRKNYFYPGLPKSYKISQYDTPLAKNGYLELVKNGQLVKVGIEYLLLEEDVGDLFYDDLVRRSYLDFNHCGAPLIEIATAPDIRSPEEAYLFLDTLKRGLSYTGISDCKMEEKSLRCNASISLRPFGVSMSCNKVKIKNMNSFNAVQKALEYESRRQKKILEKGGQVTPGTRRWCEKDGTTILEMWTKGYNYLYSPEPDLPPIVMDEKFIKC